MDNKSLLNENGIISVADGGITEKKLSQSVKEKLNANRVQNNIGSITITNGNYVYIATDYVNADGDIEGKANTVEDFQNMIDACSATGGTIFFPDGHYKCIVDGGINDKINDKNGAIFIKDGVHLVGASRDSVILEMRSDAKNVHTIRNVEKGTFSISNMTLLRTTSGVVITPSSENMNLRSNIRIDAGSSVRLNNVLIKNENFNDGYDEEIYESWLEAKAAYMAVILANNVDFIAYDSIIDSSAWGLFLISESGKVEWNGTIKSWYKSIGIHGADSKVICNGYIETYGEGGFGSLSCSGGELVVNGTIKRVVDTTKKYAYLSSVVSSNKNTDQKCITINGYIYTNTSCITSDYGVIQVNANIYCLHHEYQEDYLPSIFKISSGVCNFVGNVYSDQNVEYIPFELTDEAKMFFTGNISVRGNSIIGLNGTSDKCQLYINGNVNAVAKRFIRLYRGKVVLTGNYQFSNGCELIQIISGGKKTLIIQNALLEKGLSKDKNITGNELVYVDTSYCCISLASGAEELERCSVIDSTYLGRESYAFSEGDFSADIVNLKSNVSLGSIKKKSTLNVL